MAGSFPQRGVISPDTASVPPALVDEPGGTTRIEYLSKDEFDMIEDFQIGADSGEPTLNGIYDDQSTIEGSDEGDLKVLIPKEGVSIEKNDRSLSEFERWYKQGRLIIDPEWQRSYIWDRSRASKLIESFLVDIPVPVIYLSKNEGGKYEVIDGVQRLTSIFKYFNGEFPLSGLVMLKLMDKKKFSELPSEMQNKLSDATLRTFELSPQTSKNLLFTIFERLNTGGVALTEMEIRNCIYRGKTNDLIKKLAVYEEFVKSVNQKDLSRGMLDRSLVLRFLAFYEKGYQKAQEGLKTFINDFFEYYKNPLDSKLDEFENQFKKATRAAYTVFGDFAYRLRRQDSKGGGEWATRVNAAVFQVIAVSFTNDDLGQVTQRRDAILEEYLDMVTCDSNWLDSVSRSTGDARRIRYTFQTWNDRLGAVMEGSIPLDTKRTFSANLKKEMFKQNPTCSLCGQEIRLINDAALDHEEHYWRSGKTIPSNARLAHRLCNMKRPK